jgi:hypothetical protein
VSAMTKWAPPSGLDAELVSAGRWWDAVRVPVYLGERVLDLLNDASGAVIRDPYGPAYLYWLVRPGAADGWTLPEVAGVRVLGAASYVVVPPRDPVRPDGLGWAVPFRPGRYLTDAVRLHAALAKVFEAEFGVRPEAAR